MRRLILLANTCGLLLILVAPAHAQLNGSHTLGDFGVQSGTQPPPGFYAALLYLRYDTDTIKDADGNTVRLSPQSPGSLAVSALAPMAWYVSKAKFLGANYGAMVAVPLANVSLEAPALALANTVDTSVSDLLVGKTVGSRVLLDLPPTQQGGDPTKDSVAVVIDILAQNGTAKQESAS